MIYDFDERIDRRNTNSAKWDMLGETFGNPDALPMWVADMEFRCPQPVIDAVKRRAESGIFGYPGLPARFQEVTQHWVKQRHGWEIQTDSILFAASVIPALYSAVQALTE
ncbi:MAG: cystathionine beta-lyase, partial [Butyricicoccaceae bacterium]